MSMGAGIGGSSGGTNPLRYRYYKRWNHPVESLLRTKLHVARDRAARRKTQHLSPEVDILICRVQKHRLFPPTSQWQGIEC
jgi:hypothetical protein